jgi:hypothetical protein
MTPNTRKIFVDYIIINQLPGLSNFHIFFEGIWRYFVCIFEEHWPKLVFLEQALPISWYFVLHNELSTFLVYFLSPDSVLNPTCFQAKHSVYVLSAQGAVLVIHLDPVLDACVAKFMLAAVDFGLNETNKYTYLPGQTDWAFLGFWLVIFLWLGFHFLVDYH